jgi:hypothetical protein
MGRIASWQKASQIAGETVGTPANKCPTRSAVEATGKLAVAGTYAPNRLVYEGDISKSGKTIHFYINCPDMPDGNVRVWVSLSEVCVDDIIIGNCNLRDESENLVAVVGSFYIPAGQQDSVNSEYIPNAWGTHTHGYIRIGSSLTPYPNASDGAILDYPFDPNGNNG